MERKSKVMLAAALGAVAILVASSVVRCTLAGPQRDEAPEEAARAAQGQEAEPQDAPEGQGTLALLRSHAWQAEGDAGKTAAFTDGAIVETDGGGVHVSAFEVVSETEDSLDVKVTSDGGGERSATISISGAEGSYRVSCDAFQVSQAYVQGSAGKAPVAVEGVTEPYTTLVDGKTDELASAIAAYCRAHVPTATKAVFDGEVFLDVSAKTVSATFHCDDAAATILQVTYADGAFAVAG
jgi:hypothetical protein